MSPARGDTAIALLHLDLFAERLLLEAAEIANHGSAVVCQQTRNRHFVTRDELIASFQEDSGHD